MSNTKNLADLAAALDDGTSGQVLQSTGSGGVQFADAAGADLYAANESSPTAQPSATGANAIAIGDSAVANNTQNVAIGYSADATTGTYNSAFGAFATANASYYAVAIGSDAGGNASTAGGSGSFASSGGVTAGNQAQALGKAYASGVDSFAAAIGTNSSSYGATGTDSIAMGYQAKASTHGVGLGYRAEAGSTYTVALGADATTSAQYATAIGRASTASGSYSTAIGRSHTASASYASSLGGYNGTTSATYATTVGGRQNRADGSYSVASGYGADVNNIIGKVAHAPILWISSGDTQSGKVILTAATTNATATVATSNGGSASATNQVVLPNNCAYAFHGTIVARQQASGGTACAAWKVEGLIRREGTAGTTTLVNSATTVLDNTPSWGMALSADTTNGALAITCTGAASTNIRWVATIHTSEVIYA